MKPPVTKLRELQRDLLYVKHGEQWREHEANAGKFWAPMSEAEGQLLATILDAAERKPS